MSPEKVEYGLNWLVSHAISRKDWQRLDELLLNIFFLELKAEAGMVFEFTEDFSKAVKKVAQNHINCRFYGLIEEAIRRDIHFMDRHPSTLFQCLWNSCWWYDCPDAAKHYEPPEEDCPEGKPPWEREGPKLYKLLEEWRKQKEKRDPNSLWIRSIRPPYIPLEGAQETILLGHEFRVSKVAISHDNSHIVSASGDKTIRVWNLDTGRELASLQNCNTFPVKMSFLNNTDKVIYATNEGKVYVWDWHNKEKPACVSRHNHTVQNIVLFPDDSRKRTKRTVWNTKLSQKIEVNCPVDEIDRVICSQDGRLIAIGCSDEMVCVFANDSRNEICRFTRDKHSMSTYVHSLAFSKDSKFLAVSGFGGVSIWELKTGKRLHRFTEGYRSVSCVDFSNDSRLIALGARDCTVRILNLQNGNEEQCFSGHDSLITCVFFTKDDSLVVSGSDDMSIRIWNLSKKTFEKHRYGDDIGRKCTFSADGQRLSSLEDASLVRIWNSENGEQITNLYHCDKSSMLLGPERHVNCTAFSPDGCKLATGSGDSTIRLWDIESKKELVCLSGHSGVIEEIGFALGGRRIVSWGGETLRIWETHKGLQLNCIGETMNRVYSYALSLDGKYAVAGLENGVILLVDTNTGGILKRICDMGSRINHIVFSPTNRFVICSVWRRGIYVCDITKRNELLQVIEPEALMIRGKAFSPDDRWLAWKKKDDSIIVWDMKYNREHLCIKERNCTSDSLMFLWQDPGILVGWGDEEVIWGWDVVNGRPLEKNEEIIHKLVKGKVGKIVRWQISNSPLELKLRPLECLEDAAWFPGKDYISSFHPSGRTWAISTSKKLELVTLEGDVLLSSR